MTVDVGVRGWVELDRCLLGSLKRTVLPESLVTWKVSHSRWFCLVVVSIPLRHRDAGSWE